MAIINRRSSRKSLALALAIVGVAGLSMASAAQLTVNSTDVVAGVAAIDDCGAPGVTVTYSPTYSSTVPGYTVNSVELSGLAACAADGSTVIVTLTDNGAVALTNGSGSDTVSGDTLTVSLAGAVDVSTIYGVAVAIG